MSSSKNVHIIGTSPDDTLMISYLLLAGKSAHVPGNLSRGSHLEWNAKVNALIGPHFKEGNGSPRCTLWHVYKNYKRSWSMKWHTCIGGINVYTHKVPSSILKDYFGRMFPANFSTPPNTLYGQEFSLTMEAPNIWEATATAKPILCFNYREWLDSSLKYYTMIFVKLIPLRQTFLNKETSFIPISETSLSIGVWIDNIWVNFEQNAVKTNHPSGSKTFLKTTTPILLLHAALLEPSGLIEMPRKLSVNVIKLIGHLERTSCIDY